MSRRILLTVAAAAVLLAAAPAVADEGTPPSAPAPAAAAPAKPAPSSDALEKKVAQLEDRVSRAEAEIEASRHHWRVERPDSHAESW
jgi:hypothetical protein